VALGWLHEPAFVGFDNAVQVLVKQGEAPFTDITDKDLTVAVSVGGKRMDPQPLAPTADPDTGLGTPGEYEFHFIPTVPGAYTFHLKGKIKDTPVDETVTAGDKTRPLPDGRACRPRSLRYSCRSTWSRDSS